MEPEETARRLSPIWPGDGSEAWEEISPDGMTRVEWRVSHGRMSHAMVTPQLYDAATGTLLLALDGSFDAEIEWGEEGAFTMWLRHYLRSGQATVEIERRAGRFRFLEEGGRPGPWLEMARLKEEVEARFTPSMEEVERLAGQPRTPAPPRPWWPLGKWRVAGAILCLAAAGLTLLW